MAWQTTPRFLFDLAEKKMGRGRSKRKERQAPNLRLRASWLKYGGCPECVLSKPGQSPTGTRRTLGNRNTPCPRVGVRRKPPGRSRIPLCSLSAGAAWAVDAGRRGRRPLQDNVCRGGPVCPPVAGPSSYPRRGGCPHPPCLARPPSTTEQSASEFRRTGLSTTTPKFPPDPQSRRKTRATE